MDKSYEVEWTERSLLNALNIKKYLNRELNLKAVSNFETLLKEFELTVTNFPTLYPESRT